MASFGFFSGRRCFSYLVAGAFCWLQVLSFLAAGAFLSAAGVFVWSHVLSAGFRCFLLWPQVLFFWSHLCFLSASWYVCFVAGGFCWLQVASFLTAGTFLLAAGAFVCPLFSRQFVWSQVLSVGFRGIHFWPQVLSFCPQVL